MIEYGGGLTYHQPPVIFYGGQREYETIAAIDAYLGNLLVNELHEYDVLTPPIVKARAILTGVSDEKEVLEDIMAVRGTYISPISEAEVEQVASIVTLVVWDMSAEAEIETFVAPTVVTGIAPVSDCFTIDIQDCLVGDIKCN